LGGDAVLAEKRTTRGKEKEWFGAPPTWEKNCRTKQEGNEQ